MKTMSLMLLVILASGCASRPTLTYKKITPKSAEKASAEITDSYYLNTSLITITPIAGSASPVQYSITSEPVESLAFKVGVIPRNSIVSTTKLKIVKAENSDRFASGGTETTENLKSFISTVGGVLAQAVAIGGGAPSPRADASCGVVLDKAFTIDLTGFMTERKDARPYFFDETNSASRCVEVEVDELPPDAMPVDKYPWDTPTSHFYYSACRNVKVTVSYPDKRQTVKNLKIADPHYLQSVQYPYKGVVTMHSQCGVSVVAEAYGNPMSGLDSVAELLKQIEEIRKAK